MAAAGVGAASVETGAQNDGVAPHERGKRIQTKAPPWPQRVQTGLGHVPVVQGRLRGSAGASAHVFVMADQRRRPWRGERSGLPLPSFESRRSYFPIFADLWMWERADHTCARIPVKPVTAWPGGGGLPSAGGGGARGRHGFPGFYSR